MSFHLRLTGWGWRAHDGTENPNHEKDIPKMKSPRITIWNEFVHERKDEPIRAVYPDGIHQAISRGMQAMDSSLAIRTATLDQPEHGLTEEVLAETDVLYWWGHCAHGKVEDAIVSRVQQRVLQGMGLVVLHSGHFSKIFCRLMGTSCALKWREVGEKERVWVTQPGHRIVRGLPPYFEVEKSEMYGEPFGIPPAEEQVFLSWYQGGEVFRSGCCWRRGAGKIFYFSPGHETYPIYHQEIIHRILVNAAYWAAPEGAWEDVAKAANVPAEKAAEPLPQRAKS